MIRYNLKCAEGHAFDSWFQSAAAYDDLQSRQLVQCPDCGSAVVEKGLMAPAVRLTRAKSSASDAVATEATGPLSTPETAREQALAALRHEVESKSEYVGMNFAAQARGMHDGTLPNRPIYGEAKWEEAKALLEDGVPVAPLPFMPVRKTN